MKKSTRNVSIVVAAIVIVLTFLLLIVHKGNVKRKEEIQKLDENCHYHGDEYVCH